jgi:hypothetical protein
VADEADGKMQEEKIFMDANHFDERLKHLDRIKEEARFL